MKTITTTSWEVVDWEAVYWELLPRVYNYFRYRTGDAVIAEDLTATVFEEAWRSRLRYRRDLSAFSTWIFTIARRVAAKHFKKSRFREVSWDAAQQTAADLSVEAQAERKAVLDELATQLARLSARERELIALKYGARFTNREIAKLTGLSESNVGTILHRTVATLRSQMEGA